MKIIAKLHVIAAVGIVILTSFCNANAQESSRPATSYKVLPGDVLQVSVWKEPDLQLELLVRPDGASMASPCH
jgi:protein involved in polysaccharide export with SLBB domain